MPFSARLVMSKVELFRHEWIWIKNRGSNFANTTREPFKEHESVLVFSRGQWTFNRQMQPRTGSGAERVNYELNWRSKSSNYRDFEDREGVRRPKLRVPSSWQKFNVEVGLHPTQKPVPLFAYLVRTYTNENDLVLDTHSGSGTTAMACVGTKRNFVGCEKDRAYWEKAVNRLEAKLKPLGAQSAERGQWSF
jgi:site-specific DNA-methyltransferase (adenine-specific)